MKKIIIITIAISLAFISCRNKNNVVEEKNISQQSNNSSEKLLGNNLTDEEKKIINKCNEIIDSYSLNATTGEELDEAENKGMKDTAEIFSISVDEIKELYKKYNNF